MLHKNHISNIEIYSEEWRRARLGRFTSSKIAVLCGEKEFTDGAMTYIYQKAGEYLTGQCGDDEDIETEHTAWGNTYEPEALKIVAKRLEIQYLATQKLIFAPDSQFSSTPDGIWIKGLAESGDEYNVRTIEVKCPKKFEKFFPLSDCKTPADLKKANKQYYWQVVDQMDNCGSVIGYFAAYHPLIPNENLNLIQFNKLDMWDDFKLLQARKKSAIQKFNERVEKHKKQLV